MVAAVQPFIDAAISKTVNVPADYSFEDFKDLYLEAWRSGLKGLATFRPNPIPGEALSDDVTCGPVAGQEDELVDRSINNVLFFSPWSPGTGGNNETSWKACLGR